MIPWRRPASAANTDYVMLDALPFPIWLRNGDLQLIWCNQAYSAAVEQPREQILNKQTELLKTAHDADGRQLARKALQEHQPQMVERYLILKGQRRLCHVYEQPQASGMLGYAQDMGDAGDLRQQVNDLRATEKQTMQQILLPLAIFDRNQMLQIFNPAFAALTGLDEEWLATQPRFGHLLDALRDARKLPEQVDFRIFKQQWLAWFLNLVHAHQELLHLPDGQTWRLGVVPHPQGGLILTFEDITDRLALEASYNTVLAVQRETLDYLQEAVAVVDSRGKLRLANPAFLKMWGLPSALTSQHPHWREICALMAKHFVAAAWSATYQDILNLVTTHITETTQNNLHLHDDRVIDAVFTPLPDGGVLVRLSDMTNRWQVEKALGEKAEALAAADKLKSQFLMNVSYQLRTPLNTIIGFSELLQLPTVGEINARQGNYIKDILQASEQLRLLIDNLIELSSLQAGFAQLDRHETDVFELLCEVRNFTETLTQHKRQVVVIDCPATVGSALFDRQRIQQALLNLIINAIHHAPLQSTITLQATRQDDQLILSVKDQGSGLPATIHSRLGEPFNVLPGGQTLGMGLALVKNLIELHGGKIEAIRHTVGSEIQCILPA